MAEEFIRLVVVKIRLAQILQVLGVVLVQLNDLFNERLFAWKIEIVEKAFGIEFPRHAAIAPIDGQGARLHGVNNFFRRVAGDGGVLEGEIKFAGPQEFDLRRRAARQAIARIVERRSHRVHFLVAAKLVEKLVAHAGFPVGVAGQETAKPGF